MKAFAAEKYIQQLKEDLKVKGDSIIKDTISSRKKEVNPSEPTLLSPFLGHIFTQNSLFISRLILDSAETNFPIINEVFGKTSAAECMKVVESSADSFVWVMSFIESREKT